MDTNKIINDIIEQTNVEGMKNELINLKVYLNSIDTKIISLNSEEDRVKIQLKNITDEIINLKEKILACCNDNYEKQLKEIENDRLEKSQIHIDLINEYEKYIKKLFFKQETASKIKANEAVAQKQYEDCIIKENKFKEEYQQNIDKFEEIFEYYSDYNKLKTFDKKKFEYFKTLKYFNVEQLEFLIDLILKKASILNKYYNIEESLTLAEIEKVNTIAKIEELEPKVEVLIERRKKLIENVQDTASKTSEILEGGVKGATEIGNLAYEVIKNSLFYNKENLGTEEKDTDSTQAVIQDALVEDIMNGIISVGKKKIKSFLSDNKK